MGFDPAEVYDPWFTTDLGQQALLGLTGIVGDGALAVSLAALLLRVAVLPLNLRSLQKQCDRVQLLPIYIDFARAIEDAKKRRGGAGGTGARGAEQAEADLARLTAQFQDFAKTTSFNPMQGMGFQLTVLMPIYIAAYMVLRGIVTHPDHFRSVVTTPTLWLDSLVLPDPFGALPAISALAILMNAELNGAPPRPGQEESIVYFKLVLRGAVLTFVPFTALMPSAVLVFMATNAAVTAMSTWAFRRYRWQPPHIDPRWIVPAPAGKGK